ncbi:MAG: TonB family protein [Woeseiaceae bacterium]|nr:TonB family protein [Woeseiaceae bacterium]
MAHKNEKKPGAPSGNDTGDGSVGDEVGNEFEDAVTTAITGVMARAFEHDLYIQDSDEPDVAGADTAAPPPSTDDDLLDPGFVLNNRFEIVELVHAGGMSHVYRAIDRRRDPEGSGQTQVAIKMMRQSVASERDARLALEREAARAQRLSHPNIVNVFDFDEHDGHFYLVMEWLDGESVNALLRRTRGQRLDQAFAWQIIEGTAAGVQHAHLNNVVHADINPANIFITTTHQVKLLDFGVARNCGDPSDTEQDRLLWATRDYASPEVLSGIAPVVEDDIFSLGSVAYRLLGGSLPFPSTTSLEARRDDVEVAAIPGLAEDDWQTLRRALDYSRSKRPKSAAVFYRGTKQAPGHAGPPEKPTEKLWIWPLAAIVAAILIMGGVLFLGGTPESPAPSAATQSPGPADTAAEVPPSDIAEPAAEVAPVAALLEAAELALADTRYVTPPGDNALDYFREMLRLEPGNPAARNGLRSISDRYVREAEAALRSGLPAESAGALAIAADTDPDNPAIQIVEYLLVAEGNQQLANARAAALSGDADQARALLAQAEQYASVDPAAIAGVAAIISAQAEEDLLRAGIDLVDQRIAADQLLAPPGDSARDVLLELRAEYGDDARVAAAAERLGQRLLTDAALATAAAEYTQAEGLLAAVEALGVLDAEVEAARSTLQAALEEPVPEVDVPMVEGTALVATAAMASETAGVADAADTAGPLGPTEAPASGEGPAPTGDMAGSVAAISTAETAEPQGEPERIERQSLSQLGIERYVAPKFPRAAQRMGASGFVEVGFVVNPDGTTGQLEILKAVPSDVFNDSAEKAVGQWRFAPRSEPVPARIVLSFEAE